MTATHAILLAAFAVALVSSTSITQSWFTDSACTQNENTVQINAGQCYLDAADYSGMQWICASGNVVAVVYNYGDENCTGAPIAKKIFPQGTCTGPVYNNLYLIASGCS